MRKPLFVLIGILLVGCTPADKEVKMDNSMDLAKKFCVSTNNECLNVLSFDFDKAYREGQIDSASRYKWSTLIKRKSEELEDLCLKAPNKQICNNYRDTLMSVYMAGLDK